MQAHIKQGMPLEPGMEISYVVKDAMKWEVDPARTASEFDAAYYRGLLGKAWEEASLGFDKDWSGSFSIRTFISAHAEQLEF